MTTPPNPQALLRSKRYLLLLVLAAVVGVPISAAAYGFLALVNYLQREVFTHLPDGLGFHGAPPWWPLPMLIVAGLLVGPVIRYLPGRGGHSPADGFKPHGAPTPAELPGVLLAALATLIFGVVLGPEAPLIALGGGLAVLAVRLTRRDMPAQALAVVGSAGSFAAISTLFGSPLPGAFLLMEASGLGGAMLGAVLVPGLLAAGVGALIFVGMNAWTGLGAFSLSIPGLPHFGRPDFAEFGWALVIGIAAAIVGTAIHRVAIAARPHVERRLLIALPVVGAIVAGLAIAYAEGTGKGSSDVLFSGQSEVNPLVANAASYSVGALVLLIACKGLAYGLSMSGFRGGPTFPGIYIGAAGGIAMSHLPGLPMVAGLAMGIGAMSVVMLGLPLTSVLLASLLVLPDALQLTPLVIVAVVVAYVVSARLRPPETVPEPEPGTAPGTSSATQAPAAAAAPATAPQVPGPAPAPESRERHSRSPGGRRGRELPGGGLGGWLDPVTPLAEPCDRGRLHPSPLPPRQLGRRHIHLLHAVLVRRHQRGSRHRHAGEGQHAADPDQDGAADHLPRVDLELGLCPLAVRHRQPSFASGREPQCPCRLGRGITRRE
jgi:H+/Cl- antiporter ClcA